MVLSYLLLLLLFVCYCYCLTFIYASRSCIYHFHAFVASDVSPLCNKRTSLFLRQKLAKKFGASFVRFVLSADSAAFPLVFVLFFLTALQLLRLYVYYLLLRATLLQLGCATHAAKKLAELQLESVL